MSLLVYLIFLSDLLCSDSGMYIILIPEYFVMHKDCPKDSFDLDSHRSSIRFYFYSYRTQSRFML